VQISSAIDVPLAEYSPQDRAAAIAELADFAEDRYLHQTGVVDASGRFRLIEDLPQWLAAVGEQPEKLGDDHHLRIHFHVPVFRRTLGHLRSTQQAILECVTVISGPDAPEFTGHFEVETYAWTVLPDAITADSTTGELDGLTGLAAGIAQELDWFESMMNPPPATPSNHLGNH
jgi:hypothetical protein